MTHLAPRREHSRETFRRITPAFPVTPTPLFRSSRGHNPGGRDVMQPATAADPAAGDTQTGKKHQRQRKHEFFDNYRIEPTSSCTRAPIGLAGESLTARYPCARGDILAFWPPNGEEPAGKTQKPKSCSPFPPKKDKTTLVRHLVLPKTRGRSCVEEQPKGEEEEEHAYLFHTFRTTRESFSPADTCVRTHAVSFGRTACVCSDAFSVRRQGCRFVCL